MKSLTDKGEKYCKLEPETNDLEGLLSQKKSLEKQWKEKISPLEVKKNQLYSAEINTLGSIIKNLFIENPHLEDIEEKLSEAQTQQQRLTKEIDTLRKNVSIHRG